MLRQSAESAEFRGDLRSRLHGSGARGGAIKELVLLDDSDGGAGGVRDLLHSFGNQFGCSGQVQLQGLNQFLSFYDRGKIFREVRLKSLRPQTIIVLLEHIGCREKLLKRSLVEKRLSLRAGSCLGHECEYPASRWGIPETLL